MAEYALDALPAEHSRWAGVAGEQYKVGSDPLGAVAAEPAEDSVVAHETTKIVRIALSTLRGQERKVLELRFGFDGQAPLTLQAIAVIMGLSRERIRQIERKALGRLRRYPAIRGGFRPTRYPQQRAQGQGTVGQVEGLFQTKTVQAPSKATHSVTKAARHRDRSAGRLPQPARTATEISAGSELVRSASRLILAANHAGHAGHAGHAAAWHGAPSSGHGCASPRPTYQRRYS